ncbi:MAG: transposase [Roseiflexaceae bacterium]
MPIVPPVLRAGTRDLPDVPPLVQYLIGAFLAPILAWLSSLVYRPLLQRAADHPLVLLAHYYDPAAVVAACAAYHHAPDTPGRPPTFTIEQFVRAEIVRAWADCCSDPALEELLTTNLLIRWFVDLPLAARAPDHSTLADFHAFLTTHAPDAFFRDVLTFLGGVDPEPPDATPQIVDTFAMASPAAATSSVAQLLRHLTLRLVRLWFAHAPDALLHAVPPLDLGALAHPGYARTALARQQHLQTAVAVTSWVVSGITPHLPLLEASLRSAVVGYLDALAKVQADELFTDASGYVQERAAKDRGERRIGSAVDSEATFRKHDGSPAVLGTNAVISVTTTRIRAAVALTGSTPDSEAPCAVLTQQQQANQGLPPHLIMDQAGGWGKTRARVAALSEGQTSMVAWVPTSGGSDPHRFSVADFQVDVERTSCTCPNGVVSTRAYAHGDAAGVFFRFLASQCRGCPLWSECRDAEANPKGHRSVFISDYHSHLRAGAAFNQTPTGRALLNSRWRVEPTVAWLVRYQGCRHSRRVGQAAAQLQLFQACAMRNLLLWLGRLRRGTAPQPSA